jgi:hypothetical protein
VSKRAERKKAQKHFKVGDVVTWGACVVAHRIAEVTEDGVLVDITSQEDAHFLASKVVDGKYLLFVSFDRNNRSRSGRGPVCHTDMEPDKPPRVLI